MNEGRTTHGLRAQRGENPPTLRDGTPTGLLPREDAALTLRALRCGWLIDDPAAVEELKARINEALQNKGLSVKEQMLAGKVLLQLCELERRIRRDDADMEARREKRTVSVVESALRSKEGFAAALERVNTLASALREPPVQIVDNAAAPVALASTPAPPPVAPPPPLAPPPPMECAAPLVDSAAAHTIDCAPPQRIRAAHEPFVGPPAPPATTEQRSAQRASRQRRALRSPRRGP